MNKFRVVFGDGTFSNTGASDGCPAAATDVNDPSTGQTVNRLIHCCTAETNAGHCPKYANDSMWAKTDTASSTNGAAFVTNTVAEGSAFASVISGHSRFTADNKEATYGSWFTQLPVPSGMVQGLVASYMEDFSADTAFEAFKANAGQDVLDSGCNNDAGATANVNTWADCMICSATNGSVASADNLYTAPTAFENVATCQGTLGGDGNNGGNGNNGGDGNNGGGDGNNGGENGDGDDDDPECPENCKSSVLKTLGMSVIFAFIINMMN